MSLERSVVGRDPRRVSDAVLALVVQQEARGHALDGDSEATERVLDRSTDLSHAAAERPEDASPWTYFYDQRRLAFQRGIAYVELGRHRDTVPLLNAALDGLTAGTTGTALVTAPCSRWPSPVPATPTRQ